jgi:hypothetical protein
MKITINSNNKNQYIEKVKESIKRFLTFCNEYPEEYNYNSYKDMAQFTYDNLESKIALHVLNFSIPTEDILNNTIYPGKMIQMLYNIRQYVFNNSTDINNYLNLQQQNEATKNYIHFDFSVKKIKTLNDI